MYFNPLKEGNNEPHIPAARTIDELATTVANTDPVSQAKNLLQLHRTTKSGMDFERTNELALEFVDEILDHWLPDGDQRGHEYLALNPTRNDNGSGSFSVNTESGLWADFASDDSGGDLTSLIKYVTDCKYQSEAAVKILEFIAGMQTDDGAPVVKHSSKPKKAPKPEYTAIMPIPEEKLAGRPVFFGAKLGTPGATWEYRNATGQAMCFVLRFDLDTGKTFRPQTFCKDSSGWGQWTNTAPPVPRPAYGLDRLAARPDACVLFAEGEKAADAAQRLFPGFVAVTTMNGSKSPEKTDYTPFAGRKIYIAPDNDEAGTTYKDSLIKLLRDAGAEIVAVMRLETLAKNGTVLADKYDLADAEADGWTAEALSKLGTALWIPVTTDEDSQKTGKESILESMPDNFYMNADGLHFIKQKEKDEESDKIFWICSPIEVSALTRSENSSGWGKLLTFNDADEVKHSWALPAEMLAGSGQEYREVLLSCGASIATGVYERAKLGLFLQTYKPASRALSVSQPGWHGKNFVLGERAFGPSAEKVVLQTRSPASYAIYTQGGTFEQWKENVAMPAAGNSRLILAICASLAGPVLHLTKEESGGFHYRGRSSIGKSIGLNVGASVWGGRSFLVQWNSTDNGLESTACRYNDMMLGLDELGEMDPAKAGKVAYMLANGQGKVRADIHADAKMTKKWRLIILSSGEVSLADHMASAGQTIKAGQEIRLVDIPADPGKGLGVFETIHGNSSSADFAIALRENAFTHFGHAGTAFVTLLTDPEQQPAILNAVRTVMQAFKQAYIPAGADGQVVRVGHRFALVAAVGEICITLGILPWTVGEANSGINGCYQAWIETRGGIGNLESDQIIAQVRKYLEQHGESRFTEMVPQGVTWQNNVRTINRAGFRRAVGDGTEFLMLPETYKSDICRGHDPRYVTQVLISRGFLKVGKDGKSQITTNLPGMGSKRVYHFLPTLMGEQSIAIAEPESPEKKRRYIV